MEGIAAKLEGKPLGRWVFRALVLSISFFYCGYLMIAMSLGLVEGDPSPHASAFLLHGTPTFIAWVLVMAGVIDEVAELKVFTLANWAASLADAVHFSYSSDMGMQDLWMKASVAPMGYVLSHSCIKAMEVPSAGASTGVKQPWNLGLLVISVLIRRVWDEQMQGLVSAAFFCNFTFVTIVGALNDYHNWVARANQEMKVEKSVQESLLRVAFDATFTIAKANEDCEAMDSDPCSHLNIFKSSSSFDALMGKPMSGKSLADAVIQGMGEMCELVQEAEESQWDPRASGTLCRALITCVDGDGSEFDCVAYAVARAPYSQAKAGALVCGLRIAGEKRQSVSAGALSGHSSAGSSGRGGKGSGSDWTKPKRGAEATAVSPSSSFPGALRSIGTIMSSFFQQQQEEQRRVSKSSAVGSSQLEGKGVDCQIMAWQTLTQVSGACAIWCRASDLIVVQTTPTAEGLLGKVPGEHVASIFPYASHVVLLRKAINHMKAKTDANPDCRGFFVGREMSLPVLTVTLAHLEARVTVILFPGDELLGRERALFLVLGVDRVMDMMQKPMLPSVVETDGILPDDSASQIESGSQGASSELGSGDLHHRHAWSRGRSAD